MAYIEALTGPSSPTATNAFTERDASIGEAIIAKKLAQTARVHLTPDDNVIIIEPVNDGNSMAANAADN